MPDCWYEVGAVRADLLNDFLPELDLPTYRARNPDLAQFDDQRLRKHYEDYGRREGRLASLPMLREHFLDLIDIALPTLEIGPFYRPVVRGSNVSYFDVLDQAGLEQRAEALGKQGQPPFIQYVSPTGDLSIVDRRFANVVSSHCIEHQPDLIRHLQSVGDILGKGGFYFLMVPDKRFCFDHFIPETTVADILCAHEEKRTVHSLASVVEHHSLTTHNDAGRHWKGDHADPDYQERIVPRARAAVDKYRNSNGRYLDVHAWQFTPSTFRSIISILTELGLSPLRALRVYETPKNRFEFTAILQKE